MSAILYKLDTVTLIPDKEAEELCKLFDTKSHTEMPSDGLDKVSWHEPLKPESGYMWLAWVSWNYDTCTACLIADPIAELNFLKQMTPVVRDLMIIDFLQGDADAISRWQGKDRPRKECDENRPISIWENIATIAKHAQYSE